MKTRRQDSQRQSACPLSGSSPNGRIVSSPQYGQYIGAARSVDLYAELEKRLPDFDEPITINVNGCPNSCARFQTGDIGLKGSIVDGEEGFQVHLGGSLGEDAGFGRKSRGLKVTADGAADYVERLLRSYLEHRSDGERFAHWVRRADEALLK